jgi:hypothetical protein
MSNLRFKPGWFSSTIKNLTSWTKPTLLLFYVVSCVCFKTLNKHYHIWIFHVGSK